MTAAHGSRPSTTPAPPALWHRRVWGWATGTLRRVETRAVRNRRITAWRRMPPELRAVLTPQQVPAGYQLTQAEAIAESYRLLPWLGHPAAPPLALTRT